MKLLSTETRAEFEKMLRKNADIYRLNFDGTLEIQSPTTQYTFDRFLMYYGGKWFFSRGAKRFSSSIVPADGCDIAVIGDKRLLALYEDGTAELITPKKHATEGFDFLLFVVCDAACELTFVDSTISPKVLKLTVEKQCILPVWALTLSLLGTFNNDALLQLRAAIRASKKEEMSEDGQTNDEYPSDNS